MRKFAIVMLAIPLFSCAALNSRQKAELTTMKAADYYVQEKSPGTAAMLGILPGFGAFYTRQYGMGVVDLLLWPFSILWDPIVGYEGALAINYSETKAYARQDMRKAIANLDDRLLSKEIDQARYIVEKRQIENQYSFE
jgi:hypothetical protein